MIFETERLILREFNQSDLKDLCEILQDEAVTAVYEHYFTEEDVQAWLCIAHSTCFTNPYCSAKR